MLATYCCTSLHKNIKSISDVEKSYRKLMSVTLQYVYKRGVLYLKLVFLENKLQIKFYVSKTTYST